MGHPVTPGPSVTLRSARLAVLGLGVSGRASLRVLTEHGARVRGFDASERAAEQASREVPGADVEAQADPGALAEAVVAAEPDICVLSPGIPATSALMARLEDAGLRLWSEIETAWQLQRELGHDAPWLTLTGTNGKTTTVSMLSSMLAAHGLRAPAVGNVGTPAIEAVTDPHLDALAVELSSFQLQLTHSVVPQASACLNLAPDHIDWHGSYEAYRAAKARVYARTELACVYNVADAATRRMVEEADVAVGARAIGFGLGTPGVGELGVVEDVLCDRAFVARRQVEAQQLATSADLEHLAGAGGAVPPHIVADALAAAAMARAHGVSPAAVAEGLRAYRPGAHRMEVVAEIDGVTWIDDSKATNAHAAQAALAAVTGPVVWVAGGLAKGASFDDLVQAVRHKLRAVVLIGVDREPLRRALARHAPEVPLREVEAGDTGEVMPRVVGEAGPLARAGDVVLLAPACASMDQFANYGERGSAFARAAREQLRDREGQRR